MHQSVKSLRRMAARYAPTQIAANIADLPASEREVLRKILEAGSLINEIFLRQVWGGNVELRQRLSTDATALGAARLHYFNRNMGPWSGLDHNAPFIPGVPEKPKHANFYPDDMTNDEFEAWLEGLAEPDREQAKGFFHTVRRHSGALALVPYSVEYGEFLVPAAQALREAAALTGNESLRRFLNSRADAFLSDQYFQSDCDWMDLDAPVDVTIGPYEVYEDERFGYKAAFEAYVTVLNQAETAALARYGQYLQELEDNLPIWHGYRNPRLGADSPIRVVDVVATFGDALRGIQTAAFNLPNDEKVIAAKGSKRVMLKNVQQAKYDQVMVPIAQRLLNPRLLGALSFEAFFTHILWHELMHGLGPHGIKLRGRATTARQELKELHAAIEEAKADICGLWAMQYLIDKGVLDARLEEQMYVTFLAGSFRSIRFGINEAHGKGQALQFNFLCDAGAITYSKRGYAINLERMKTAVRALTHILLTIEAKGDYKGAAALLKRYAKIRPRLKEQLAQLDADVPVDIEPIYSTADALLSWLSGT